MKVLTTALFAISFCIKAFATAQYPDKILFNGKEYSLNTNPLEDYFKGHPDKRPKGKGSSTALWRGYVATFEVKDSQLYVKDIQVQYWDTATKKDHNTNWKSVINEVFPEQKDRKVDYWSGLLVLPYGKLVNYVHMGYGSTFENYFLLEIKEGSLVKERQLGYRDYEQFKEKQFLAFKQTNEYQKTKAQLQKDGNTDEFIDNFLKSYVVEYTSKILAE